MPYPPDDVVRTWLDALSGLDVRVKKMFGCYCLYCSSQSVGWLSGSVLSLREVGLDYLPPDHLRRPAPGESVQEIVIPLDYCNSEWLPRAVRDTALALSARPRRKR